VSLSTIIIIWGSGKALRGKEGSMDEAVDGMTKERSTIFNAFAVGLAGNLATVMSTCFIIMSPPISYILILVVFYTATVIFLNAQRIQKKFQLVDVVQLDDLTRFPNNSNSQHYSNNNNQSNSTQIALLTNELPRYRSKNFDEIV
jgi:K+-transporting ATPase A subunit